MDSNGTNGRRRVVITGMGTINPLGHTVQEFWENALAGKSGVRWLTQVDSTGYNTHIAGEVQDFKPEDYIDRKEARRMARFAQLAVASSREALAQAKLDMADIDPYRIGVLFGNGMGGYPDTDKAVKDIVQKGGNRVDPFYMVKMLPNMAAAQVAMQIGAKGYNATISTACASAGNAMGEALEMIRAGRADVMITGGTEAGLSELGLAAFQVMKALSTNNDPPEKASRPFDAKRDGFVSSEGAAVFVIESLEHAKARGAAPLAELAGYGCTSDAHHVVVPVEDGETTAAAMTLALNDAGVKPEDVDYVNAHGTSTQMNDKYETIALKRALGEIAYDIPMSSTKSLIGHTLGASAAIESVACVQSILTGRVHPTINQEYPDPDCDLDYIPNVSREADVRVVLKNSFGFGGQNACLVFKKFEE
ncbi:MAG TPA: beta-ketoacyl-ACP synthase II [Dehalococcoidia bacterium]|jgi:3-oxoacyl-[acyl-carrier-protein] synthase II|nr:beta-ketoacyl-ACP synthase II [Dehalococcoidia bacterium]